MPILVILGQTARAYVRRSARKRAVRVPPYTVTRGHWKLEGGGRGEKERVCPSPVSVPRFAIAEPWSAIDFGAKVKGRIYGHRNRKINRVGYRPLSACTFFQSNIKFKIDGQVKNSMGVPGLETIYFSF